jgi:hypothetical protein
MSTPAMTPCEERLESEQSLNFPPVPPGYVWVRWLVCEIERLSIEALTTRTDGSPKLSEAHAALIKEIEDDVCRLKLVLRSPSAKQMGECPWCSDEICTPKCQK